MKVIFLLCFFFTVAGVSGQQDPRVIRITSLRSDNQTFQGTGFIFKRNNNLYIGTAYHLIARSKQITFSSTFGLLQQTELVAYDNFRDVAVFKFKIPNKDLPFFVLAEDSTGLTRKEHIYASGFPADMPQQTIPLTFTKSSFLRTDEMNNSRMEPVFKYGYHFDVLFFGMVYVYEGLSGAPIIEGNKVLGFISGALNDGGSAVWGIPAKYINHCKPTTYRQKTYETLPRYEAIKNGAGHMVKSGRLAALDAVHIKRLHEAIEAGSIIASHMELYINDMKGLLDELDPLVDQIPMLSFLLPGRMYTDSVLQRIVNLHGNLMWKDDTRGTHISDSLIRDRFVRDSIIFILQGVMKESDTVALINHLDNNFSLSQINDVAEELKLLQTKFVELEDEVYKYDGKIAGGLRRFDFDGSEEAFDDFRVVLINYLKHQRERIFVMQQSIDLYNTIFSFLEVFTKFKLEHK